MWSLAPLLSLLALGSASPVPADNSTVSSLQAESRADAAASTWWYPNMDHTTGAVRAYVPYLPNNDYTYQVYKSVQPGDNLADAISSGGPNGGRDNGWSFNEPRVVYLAPGTYTLSSTLYMYTDTILVGDAQNPPTIVAASGFQGSYLIVGGVESGDLGGELKFSISIKNVILDTTANSGNSGFTALSWRVAQNCNLENVVINMPSDKHTGIFMGQGSTIQVADTTLNRGHIGIYYAGHQQAQFKNIKFYQNTYGFSSVSGFAITLYSPTFDTVGYPIQLGGYPFLAVIDATTRSCSRLIVADGGFASNNKGGFMVENLSSDSSMTQVAVVGSTTAYGAATHVDTFVYGNEYSGGGLKIVHGEVTKNTRPASLAPNGKYPVGVAPSYSTLTTSNVINVKDSATNGGKTVKGDGTTDETAALNSVFALAASSNKLVFIPYGVYRVTDTLYVPPGSKIYGEAWAVITGAGSKFSDSGNPRPVVMVGKAGETGSAVLQDLRFSVQEGLPGAIILQINMAGNSPTDVAVYNSLITVGGTRETSINCGNEADKNCNAAYTGLHLTSTSSAYIDNFWSWVADHPSDGTDSSNHNIRIAAKNGVLVESTKATWLVGLGAEHWWLSQLNLHNAANVLVSFLQSETNYHQNNAQDSSPAPKLPAPWTPVSGTDPDYGWCTTNDLCYHGPAEYINGGKNIFHYCSGGYNFNNGQQGTMYIFNAYPQNFQWFGASTHASNYAVRLPENIRFGQDGGGGGDSPDGYKGAWGALVAAFRDKAQSSPA